ncbi:hypothetical protein [Enterococcus thailandicus]|nr:hypothetical protein [Enterococcus thailandicus]MDA3976106.1 hypothetical protein [Enterococcus thailandicus]MDA3980768.1 hypothetical protein [Enterococcus thailandicus]
MDSEKEIIKIIENFVYGIISIQRFNIETAESSNSHFEIRYKRDPSLSALDIALRRKIDGQELTEADKNHKNFSKIKLCFDNVEVREEEGNYIVRSKHGLVKNLLEKQRKQRELIYRSKVQSQRLVVANLVSGLENLLTSLTEYVLLNVYHNLSSIKGVTLNLNEIESFENITEIKKYAIHKYLNDKKYESFKKWFKDFVEICIGKDFLNKDNGKELNSYIETIFEIFLRRNLITHNDGVVNEIYLEKVDKKYIDGIKKGDDISVNDDYLKESARNILHFGILFVSYTLFKKRLYKNSEIIGIIESLGIELYQIGEYKAGQYLFQSLDLFYSNKGNYEDNQSTFLAKYNYWLGEKLANSNEPFKYNLEVEEYYESTKNLDWFEDQFEIAILSLKEDKEKFIAKSIDYLESFKEEKYIFNMLNWPVFDLIREEETFIEFEKTLYYT